MMQWLRRNTKQIMVVVVLLAMFSFVGAQGLYALLAPNPLNDPSFEAFGRDFTRGDLLEAQNAAGILEAMGFTWRPTNDREFSPQHWFLLIEEARRAGLQPSSAAIEEMMSLADDTWAEAGGRAAWRERVDRPISQVRAALGLKTLESQNASRVMRAAMPSEPEVKKYVRDTQEKVTIKAAVFDAANWVDPEETFSDDVMQAHFEKYRDVFPDESDDGFGYKFPRRVTVQYVIADPTMIADGIEITQDAAIDYWKRNKGKYTKRVTVNDSENQMGPLDEPAQPETRIENKKFSEARGEVINELKTQKARGLARRALDELAAQTAILWSQQPIDKASGFRSIPAGADADDYLENAKTAVEKKHNISLRYGQLDLVTAEELADNVSLGQATLPGESDLPITISELAFRVPAFYEPEANDETSARLQLYQTPNSPLTVQTPDPRGGFEIRDGRIVQKMTEGRFVTFRVTEAREASSPDSLAEVRDEVLSDLRLKSAYDRMNDVATEFAAVAQRIGAEQALGMFDDLRTNRGILTLDAPKAFARRAPRQLSLDQIEAGEQPLLAPSISEKIGRSEKFVDACFEMTKEGWTPEPVEYNSDRVTQAAEQATPEIAPKVRMVNLPKQQKRVVVDLKNFQPVDIVAYETTHRNSAFSALFSQRFAVARQQWYKPENIAKRCNFVDKQPTADDETADDVAG